MKSSKANTILKELEEVAEKLGIKIRYEKTKARGGLCKKDEQFMIIIDKASNPHYKITVLSEALKGFDLDGIYISPKIRELLEDA